MSTAALRAPPPGGTLAAPTRARMTLSRREQCKIGWSLLKMVLRTQSHARVEMAARAPSALQARSRGGGPGTSTELSRMRRIPCPDQWGEPRAPESRASFHVISNAEAGRGGVRAPRSLAPFPRPRKTTGFCLAQLNERFACGQRRSEKRQSVGPERAFLVPASPIT